MKEKGCAKTWAGYTFLGIDPKLILEALKNRIKALRSRKMPNPPQVTVGPMNGYGEIKMEFPHPIITPKGID